MTTNRKIFAAVGIIVLLAAGLGLALELRQSSKPQPTPTKSVPTPVEAKVNITAQGFEPGGLKIKRGTTVVWTNRDSRPHQVAADPYPSRSQLPELFSGVLAKDGNYSFTFSKAGTYTYQDYLNPLKFHGSIEVIQN